MKDKHTYTTHWSEVDGVFLAEVEEFPSLITHGDTAEDALAELQDLVAFVEAEIKAEESLLTPGQEDPSRMDSANVE